MSAKISPQQYLDSLRAQQVEMRRLMELYATSEKARLTAQQQILTLEEEALAVEKNITKSKEQQAKLDAKIAENKHQQALAAKRLAELEAKQAQAAAAKAEKDRSAALAKQEAALTKAFGAPGSGANPTNAVADSTKKLGDNLKSALGPAQALGSVLGQLGMSAMGIGALGGAIGAVVQGIDTLTKDSLKAQRVSAGLQFDIEGASKAFGGYVDNVSLAQSANKAYAMNVVKTGAEFEKLAKGVNAIALQFGEDSPALLLDNAVVAIGRQSKLVLDNLGILLDNAKAETLYAEALGKTVAQLTAYEKEIAFAEAAKILITKAGDEAAASVDGFAAKVQKGKVALENYRQGVLGFNTQIGKMREVLRALTDEELEQLGFGYMAAIDGSSKTGRAMDEMLDTAGAVQEYATENKKRVEDLTAAEIEYAKSIKSTGVGLAEIKLLAQELGVSYEELLAIEKKRREVEGSKQAKKEQDAETRAQIKALRDEADELEHTVELLGIAGMKQSETADIALEALRVRQQAAEFEYHLTGEIESQNEALKIQRQIDIMRAKDAAGKLDKKKGGGSGPTEADRVKAAGMATVQWMQAEVEYAEAIAAIRGTEKKDAGEIAKLRLQAADAALELEAGVLAVTRAKNSVERQNNQNRLDAIERERELLGLQYQAEERAAARDLAEQAADDIRKQMDLQRRAYELEQGQLNNVVSLEAYRYQRNEQAIKHQAAMAMGSAQTELQRLGITEQMEADLHANRISQLSSEHAAMLRVFELREQEVALMEAHDPASAAKRDDAARQLAHDREMERLQYELATKQAIDGEEQRMAEAQRARRDATFAQIEEYVGGLQQLYGQISDFAGNFMAMAADREQAALDRQVAAIQARGQAQQAALDREIDAAEGNVALQNQLRRKGAKQQAALDRQIEKAKEQHAEKQRKIESRMAGFKLLIDAVVYGVQAAGAYASYNYVQGALLTAAAVLAGAQGAMLIAGNIPGAGGATMGGASAGSSGAGGFGGTQTVDPNKIPGSDPGQAAGSAVNRQPKGAQQGATIINIQNINATGAIDDETAEKFVRAAKRVANSRES